MRRNREFVNAAIVGVLWLGAGIAVLQGRPASAGPTTAKAIEEGVTCQCGCGQTVGGCNHEGCGSKAEMQAMAEKEIASGKDSAAILQDFVLRYGTKVLSTPPPTGFNLMVWILPILGGILGLAAIATFLRRWRRASRAEASRRPSVPAAIDPETLAELNEEMKQLR